MSKYRCIICGNFITPNKDNFAVGDNVVFAIKKELVNSFRITTRIGKIEWVKDKVAGIKSGNKTFERIFDQLHPADAPSPLAYALGEICECEVPNHG
ncbi:hypothetical protein [Sodalis ligni]|uniref:Uncharacterized protein n=1 Tax=Sodalis ligni TaxID=2697027 RepID=A0A4R1NH00_9GAMM|nr:hypothetical protein [Sodalis ligni]TCL06852.1 hypothetical protein EZJ58_5149 [Sodalis ligni]